MEEEKKEEEGREEKGLLPNPLFSEGMNLLKGQRQARGVAIFDVIQASTVLTDNFLPLPEQFSKTQITALFSTVNHTLHPFKVIDNSKARTWKSYPNGKHWLQRILL